MGLVCACVCVCVGRGRAGFCVSSSRVFVCFFYLCLCVCPPVCLSVCLSAWGVAYECLGPRVTASSRLTSRADLTGRRESTLGRMFGTGARPVFGSKAKHPYHDRARRCYRNAITARRLQHLGDPLQITHAPHPHETAASLSLLTRLL